MPLPISDKSFPFPRYGQFSVPPSFYSEFENVRFALDHKNFARLGLRHRANYSYDKFSLRPTV